MPQKPRLARFWTYWVKNVTSAKERHETIVWVVTFFALVAAFVVKKQSPNGFPWLDDVLFWIGVLSALWGVLWMPFNRHEELEGRLISKLAIRCDSSPGCLPPRMGVEYDAIIDGVPKHLVEGAQFFRLALSASSEGVIKNVTVWLTKIEKAGASAPRWDGEKEKLTFVPGDRANADTGEVPDDVPVYVDVIGVAKSGIIFMGTPKRNWRYATPLHHIFSDTGDYVLHVSASADGTKTAHARLQFVWTGQMHTCALSKLPQ